MAEEYDEVDPAEEYTHGSELPLPAGETLQLEVAHENDCGNIEKALQVVDVLEEVFPAMVDDLAYFDDDSSHTVEYDDDRADY